jgi:energy-coupling factor transporter transmembrane protein EcfT
LKIIALLMLTVLVLFASSFVVFGVILAVLLGTGLMARTSPLSMIFALRKQLSLILLSFLMPVLFHTTGSILWIIGPVTVTSDGLLMGVMFASRLVLLMIASSLLVRTTKPVDLAGGFETILAPMDTFGLNSKRISSIMSLSLTSMPAIWNSARALLNRRRQGNPADRRLIPDLINFIAEMYRQAEIKEKNA